MKRAVADPLLATPVPSVVSGARRWIGERLLRPLPADEFEDLRRVVAPANTRVKDAAVLVPLVPRGAHVHVLLTQRTAHLNNHAGQISFPGGRVEDADAGREDTALRETAEEIGLARDRIVMIGRLPDYQNLTGFRISPFVGWVEPPFDLTPDPFEVADIFEAPLEHFLDRRNYQRRQYCFETRLRHYLAVPYRGRYIWGATAAMLYSLCRQLTE